MKMIGYSGRLDMRRMTGLHCGIRVTDKEKNLLYTGILIMDIIL